MKTYKNLYPRVCDFTNLYYAYRAAARGKRGRPDVAAFEFDLESNLLRLREELTAHTYDLVKWLVQATAKFPRSQRFILARTVQWTILQFQERLIEAGMWDKRDPATALDRLEQADLLLVKLRLYLRLCHDLGLLSDGQYAHVAAMVAEVGRLLGAWLKKLRPRAEGTPAQAIQDAVQPALI